MTNTLGLLSSGAPAKVEVITIGTDGKSTTKPLDLAADRFVRVDLPHVQAVWVRSVSGTGTVRATTWSTQAPKSGPFVTSTAVLPAPLDVPTRRIVPLP